MPDQKSIKCMREVLDPLLARQGFFECDALEWVRKIHPDIWQSFSIDIRRGGIFKIFAVVDYVGNERGSVGVEPNSQGVIIDPNEDCSNAAKVAKIGVQQIGIPFLSLAISQETINWIYGNISNVTEYENISDRFDESSVEPWRAEDVDLGYNLIQTSEFKNLVHEYCDQKLHNMGFRAIFRSEVVDYIRERGDIYDFIRFTQRNLGLSFKVRVFNWVPEVAIESESPYEKDSVPFEFNGRFVSVYDVENKNGTWFLLGNKENAKKSLELASKIIEKEGLRELEEINTKADFLGSMSRANRRAVENYFPDLIG